MYWYSYTRTPGTHNKRLERFLKDPVKRPNKVGGLY